MAKAGLSELFAPHFATLTDPRMERTRRHELLNMIILALCGTIAGADGWVEIANYAKTKRPFFRRFLDLPHGTPSHDTFGRVFARLDPTALLQCVQSWLAALRHSLAGEIVAIDGKTLRGSFDRAAEQSPLHLVNAWAGEARLMLGQVAVDSKSNEITAIPQLLELLDLKGATVTLDAMGCQKEIAAAIRVKEAHYVLKLKDNHPKLCEAVQDIFAKFAADDYTDPQLRQWRTRERGHGRDEYREYLIAPAPVDLVQREEWKDLTSIGMVYKLRNDGTRESETASYYLCSGPPKVKAFARAARDHWGVENSLHWSLDVTFAEDRSRVRTEHGPANLALLRRLSLSIIKQDTTSKYSLRSRRLIAGWDDEALLTFLRGFCGD
jgi:predicted transposase YbfD/YdcC